MSNSLAIEKVIKGSRIRSRKCLREALLFLAPFLIFFIIFRFIPLIWGFWTSLFKYSLLGEADFIASRNYSIALTDPIFWKSLKNTFVYVLSIIPLFIFSLTFAILINSASRSTTLYKVVMFLPYVIPLMVHGMVFGFIYEPRIGLLNVFFNCLGFATLAKHAWLGEMTTALPAVILVWIYVHLGYMMVVFHAGLQDIPNDFYDAAKIDGAGPWTQLIFITLPLLSNVMVYVLVTGTILAFQIFPLVWVLTGYGYGHGAGGPAYSTISLDLYIYQSAFRDHNLGYGAAMGFVMLLLTFLITIIPFKFLPEIKYD